MKLKTRSFFGIILFTLLLTLSGCFESNSGNNNGDSYDNSSGIVAIPVFEPASGIYKPPKTISISCATSGATIIYTTDNSIPNRSNGTVYAGPITLSEPTKIYAIAYKEGWSTSALVNATYQITPWEYVGAPSFSTGPSSSFSFFLDNAIPYVAFNNSNNGSKLSVMKFNGASWELIGPEEISTGAVNNILLFVENGIPYVAYSDLTQPSPGFSDNPGFCRETMLKFNGTSWENIGTPGFTQEYAHYASIYVSNSTPYIAYLTSQAGHCAYSEVWKYSTAGWQIVGGGSIPSAGYAYPHNIFVNNNTPYFASKSSGEAAPVIKKFNDASWVNVGNAPIIKASYFSFYLDNGQPYIAFDNRNNQGKANVMKFTGISWDTVGQPDFSSGTANEIQLVVNNQVPYVAFNNYSDNNDDTDDGWCVKKLSGFEWVSLGSLKSFSFSSYKLAIFNDIPYLACMDGQGHISVLKYAP